ncbi:MAG: hypothetical protein G01um10147_924 [Microgenomates group bacterium Gr01-1014_7]|nr:MAG: hypothetical protein G01um10147_924 [Microgenomates group bacterium Gr01-1014_7]
MIGLGKATERAIGAPDPNIEASKKTGGEFKASGGNIQTGRMPGEPSPTKALWEQPAATPAPGITPESFDDTVRKEMDRRLNR